MLKPSHSSLFPPGRGAFVGAHPPHFLQIHGWYEIAKPVVYVLTDSSGRTGRPQHGPLEEYLNRTGGRRGSFFARFTDQNFYEAILEQNVDFFAPIIHELKEKVQENRFEYVVGDSAEGYNPIHDVCRLMIGAAVEMIGRETGALIANYDYALVRPSHFCPDELLSSSIRLDLNEEQFARKAIALKICYPEVMDEINWKKTMDSYRTEYIRPCSNRSGFDGLPQIPPFYEKLGEKKVRDGLYKQAIRYEEHMVPLSKEIWSLVEKAKVTV